MSAATPTQAPAKLGMALLGGIVGIEVSIALGYYAFSTVMPQIAEGFDADSAFSLAVAATMITSVLGFVVGSTWCDRSGPRPALAWGFIALCSGALTCALAPSMWIFIIGRLLNGMGTGLLGVATYSLVSFLVPAARHTLVFGLINGAWLLPSLVAPPIVGFTAEQWGWRSVFGGLVVLLVASFVVLTVGTREHKIVVHDPPTTRTPWVTGLVAAVALFALHLAGEEVTRVSLVVSGVGVVVAVAALHRLLPAGTFRAAAGAPRLIALRALLACTWGSTNAYLVFYLQRERGLSLSMSGLVVAAAAIGWGLGANLAPVVLRRVGSQHALRYFSYSAPLMPLIIVSVIAFTLPYWVVSLALVSGGLAMGATYPMIATRAFAASPQREHGAIGGALQLGDSAASAAVLAVTGVILALGKSDGLLWVYVVPVTLGLLAVVVASRAETDEPGGVA